MGMGIEHYVALNGIKLALNPLTRMTSSMTYYAISFVSYEARVNAVGYIESSFYSSELYLCLCLCFQLILL